MIKRKRRIINVFRAFHEADISLDRQDGSTEVWKITCEPLAELIQPEFKCFWLKIYNCRDVVFEPWLKQTNAPKETWNDTKAVFQAELEVYAASKEKAKIKLSFNQLRQEFNYGGGYLYFDCDGIEIFDQNHELIKYRGLKKLCERYLEKFDQNY